MRQERYTNLMISKNSQQSSHSIDCADGMSDLCVLFFFCFPSQPGYISETTCSRSARTARRPRFLSISTGTRTCVRVLRRHAQPGAVGRTVPHHLLADERIDVASLEQGGEAN